MGMDFNGGKKKFVVNASNLHVGGGVQVATSFIQELSAMDEWAGVCTVWVSSEVYSNLGGLKCDLSNFERVRVIDVHGFQGFGRDLIGDLRGVHAVFTVFGPVYKKLPGVKSVVGFAQPWIIYSNNECYAKMGLVPRLKIRLKYFLQKIFFKKNSDLLVVELGHVKNRLIELDVKSASDIFVVNNTISSVYFNGCSAVARTSQDRGLRLGFLGRNYLHKNTAIIPKVKQILEKGGVNVKFFVTFNAAEWEWCSEEFKNSVVNVGSLRVDECPDFYEKMDGIFFPSVLECFSATPLEAMAMARPIFLADKEFNRDVCGDFGNYFDPSSADDAAKSIVSYFSRSKGEQISFLECARNHAVNFSSARGRALEYLSVIFS